MYGIIEGVVWVNQIAVITAKKVKHREEKQSLPSQRGCEQLHEGLAYDRHAHGGLLQHHRHCT